MSGREWRLNQLFAMFPDVQRGTDRMLRCLRRTSGEGRWISDTGGVRRSVRVAVTARPSSEFVLRLTKSTGLDPDLVRGLFEGTIACNDPPWQCTLECTSAETSGPPPHLLREAAALAVQDVVRGGGWEVVGSPGDHVA